MPSNASRPLRALNIVQRNIPRPISNLQIPNIPQKSNIPKHIIPHTPLHTHRLAVFQFDARFAAVARQTGHLLLQLGVLFCYGFLFLGFLT